MKIDLFDTITRLKKFKRITLGKGESKNISFTLNNEDFSYWDETKKGWIIEAGDFEIQIGASSSDIKLREVVNTIASNSDS